MIMDIIGNVNIYFHNRKTGENLHYARVVHGTRINLQQNYGCIIYYSIAWIHLQKTGDKSGDFPLLPGACVIL